MGKLSQSYLKELAEKKKYQSGGKVNVSPKTVEGYRKQYQDEVASLKDWYEKNRSRINTSVPSAYLRNQAYGPGNQSNDPYQPGQDFYPAYPFSFPELNFNIDGQPASWNYQTGIPKSFMHTLPGADQLPIPFIPPKDNVLTLSNDPQNIRDYVSEAKISGIKPNPITGAFSIDTPLILSHELGHYLNYNNPEVYQFNKQKLAETGITDTKAFQNYYGLGNRLGDSEETGAMRIVEGLSKDRKYNEFLSDAYALKQAMRREGLYDYTKGEKLTPETWNKFKDKYGDQLVYKRFADVFQDTSKDEPDTKNIMFYLPDKNSEIYLKNKEFWDSKEKYINDVYVPNLKKERLYTNYYPDKPADVYEFMQGDQAPPPNIDSGTTYIPGVDIATEEGPVQYEGSDIQKTKIPTDMWLPESGSKRGSWMKENFYNKYENTEEGRNKAYQDFLKTRRANQPLKSPDERTIEFLNEIVKNDSEPVSIAKRGALIPKYQSGGFSTEDKQFSVKKSTIPGANKGLFSKTSIKQGKLIGLAHENNQPVGTLGNMHNHSETPNMQSVKIGNQRYVYATRDIQPGEELTTNYRLQPELEQPEDFMGNKRYSQAGSEIGPIYVSNPNDPRLKRYNDSLSGYNMTKAAEAIFKSNPYNPILQQYNRQGENFVRRTGIKPTRILTASEGDFDYGDVDIDLMQESYLAKFKKPVQPVMLDPLAGIKTIKSKGLKTTSTTSASLAPPTSVDIPMRQRPTPYTVKIYDNNAKEFDIRWNPELHQREVIIPMKSPRAKTPAKHTKNYKQAGGTIGIPGVNGQVVSSGPQPLTSVKKTRGPMSKNEKGDVKTMSNKQVKKILKNIK